MRKIVFLVFLLIFLLPTTIKLHLKIDKEKIFLKIRLYPCGLFPITCEKSVPLGEVITHYPSLAIAKNRPVPHPISLRIFFTAITVRHLSLSIRLFLADKYRLAQICGLYWIFYGCFAPYFPPYLRLNFIPLFQNGNSCLTFECIFSFSAVQIIFSTMIYFCRSVRQKIKRRMHHGYSSYQ